MREICGAYKAGSKFKKLISKFVFQKLNKVLISQVRFFDCIIILRSTKMFVQIAYLHLCANVLATFCPCALMSGFRRQHLNTAWGTLSQPWPDTFAMRQHFRENLAPFLGKIQSLFRMVQILSLNLSEDKKKSSSPQFSSIFRRRLGFIGIINHFFVQCPGRWIHLIT